METVNLILGITASIVSIVSVVWSYKNSQSIKKITKQNLTVGDGSAGALGNNNRVQNGRSNQ
jgi:hypothetical protein